MEWFRFCVCGGQFGSDIFSTFILKTIWLTIIKRAVTNLQNHLVNDVHTLLFGHVLCFLHLCISDTCNFKICCKKLQYKIYFSNCKTNPHPYPIQDLLLDINGLTDNSCK